MAYICSSVVKLRTYTFLNDTKYSGQFGEDYTNDL